MNVFRKENGDVVVEFGVVQQARGIMVASEFELRKVKRIYTLDIGQSKAPAENILMVVELKKRKQRKIAYPVHLVTIQSEGLEHVDLDEVIHIGRKEFARFDYANMSVFYQKRNGRAIAELYRDGITAPLFDEDGRFNGEDESTELTWSDEDIKKEKEEHKEE